MTSPHSTVTPNTWEFLAEPMIAATGFREYDARWRFPEEINLPGMTALGLGIGTQMQVRGLKPEIVVGNDYRDYSLAIKQALMLGLVRAGIHVRDIGPALSPMAYFAQFHLDAPAVAMVTAADGPSLGMAPAGTWRWIRPLNRSGSMPRAGMPRATKFFSR